MHRKLLGLYFLGALALPLPASAQDIALGSCQSVARIYDQILCRDDIELDDETTDEMRAEYEANGINADEAMKIKALERVANIVWDIALDKTFGEDSFALTDPEISAYREASGAALDRNYQRDKQTLEEVNGILTQGNLTDIQEAGVRQLKLTLETSIKFYEQRAEQKQSMPPEFIRLIRNTESEMAEGQLRQWKVAQLLYNKYGGKVVKVSGRMEPVDAYIDFIKEVENSEHFEIHDPDYKHALRMLVMRWEDMKQGKAVTDDQAEKYFESPLYQFQD